ncbi:MAG: ethanolamine ammonia-lyase subunit EutC, partial [Alphaproteobacteria bacterium]|nr:ethanolamine ammonia-lyase subunit EutC [Alphaproteobacteria bacterium]
MSAEPTPVDAWAALRALTEARIGLARSGASLATRPMLELRLAHARARDAVQAELDIPRLAAEAGALGLAVLHVESAAPRREDFVRRPDRGRVLADGAAAALAPHAGAHDVAFVLADGLSAASVQRLGVTLLAAALPALRDGGWRVAPPVIVRGGRVAIGDAVAAALGATAVVVLLGERPGLSAPESMGAYVTWRPHAQTTDAERNCISNIRAGGLDAAAAAAQVVALLGAMRARVCSGVVLREHPHPDPLPLAGEGEENPLSRLREREGPAPQAWEGEAAQS